MTRDEAIGRIKARFDKWALDDEDMKAIQTLIPELAESKDERIIKTIRQLLETARDAHSNTSLAKPFIDALAWLEKQKECLADNSKTSTDEDEMIRKELIGALMWQRDCLDAKGPHDNELILPGFTMKVGDILEWLEKQKESLHISETCKESADSFTDDERIRKKLIEIIGYFRSRGIDQQLCEEFIAYLEKQKEPENTSASTMAPSCWEVEQKEQKPKAKAKSPLSPHELYDAKIEGISQGRQDVLDHPEQFGLQKPAEWNANDKAFIKDCAHILDENGYEASAERLLSMFPVLRPSWKPSEKQTNNVIVELTRIELGDIINGLYYLKEKYYEDCKEHNGTATVGLSDEFKFYFKRFNEALDLYTRLHELEKERYGTTTDGYYYE